MATLVRDANRVLQNTAFCHLARKGLETDGFDRGFPSIDVEVSDDDVKQLTDADNTGGGELCGEGMHTLKDTTKLHTVEVQQGETFFGAMPQHCAEEIKPTNSQHVSSTVRTCFDKYLAVKDSVSGREH